VACPALTGLADAKGLGPWALFFASFTKSRVWRLHSYSSYDKKRAFENSTSCPLRIHTRVLLMSTDAHMALYRQIQRVDSREARWPLDTIPFNWPVTGRQMPLTGWIHEPGTITPHISI